MLSNIAKSDLICKRMNKYWNITREAREKKFVRGDKSVHGGGLKNFGMGGTGLHGGDNPLMGEGGPPILDSPVNRQSFINS